MKKPRDKRNFSDDLGCLHPPKQVTDRASLGGRLPDPPELGIAPSSTVEADSFITVFITFSCHAQDPSQTVLSSKAGAHLICSQEI